MQANNEYISPKLDILKLTNKEKYMITLFAFLLLIIGSANWLTIGLLQFDFVAGLFGSQSNIFSRIVYVLIGVGAIITTVNVIKNKGKLVFNFRKLKLKKQAPAMQAEQGKDMGMQNTNNYTPQAGQFNQPQNSQQMGNNQQQMQSQQSQTPLQNNNYFQNPQQNYSNGYQNETPHAQNSPFENNWQTTQPPEEPRREQRFNTEVGSDFRGDFRSISSRLAERHNQNRNNQ